MAIDKAVDSAVLDAGLTAIANAIREKAGTEKALAFPDGLVEAIGAIEGGGIPVKAYGTITLSEDQTANYTIDTGVTISSTDISCVIFNHNINERVQGSLLYTYIYGRSASSNKKVSAGYRAGAADTIYQSGTAGITSIISESLLTLGGNTTANYSYGLKAGYKYLWFVMEGA